LSSYRTARNRTPSRLTLTLASSAVAVAAFASGAAATALAGPAGPSAAPHAADIPAGPVGPAGRSAPASQAGAVSPARLANQASAAGPAGATGPVSLVSPVTTARNGIVLLAAARTPRQIARRMLPKFHWSVARQFRYLNWLWQRESGWNKYAYNPYSGAYGIPQALPGSKMASAGPNWRSNASTQIRWGLRYIRARYGSPRRAWNHSQATGWY